MAMFRDFSQGESVLRLSALAAGRIRIFISTQKHYALHPLPGAKTKNLSRLCILVGSVVAANRVLFFASFQHRRRDHALHESDRDAQLA